MIFSSGVLECGKLYPETKRAHPFRFIKVLLSPTTDPKDRELINALSAEADELAQQVNKGSANDATAIRSMDRLRRNALAGLLSERAWRLALNHLVGTEYIQPTTFDGSRDQVDLISTDGKRIEVRSSFPRKGFEFAICHPKYEFDVIGPYVNLYKSGETPKDIYVRTLFPFDESELFERISNSRIDFFLAGGASKEMFQDVSMVVTKSMTPMDDIILNQAGPETNYKVIPFSKSLDTLQVAEILGYAHKARWDYFQKY
jgi:hypothetical protein